MTKKIILIIGIIIIIGLAIFWIAGSSKPSTVGDSSVGFSIRDFLPFGSNDVNIDLDSNSKPIDSSSTTTQQTNTPNNLPIPKLRKISSEPVAGAVIFNKGTTSIARFVEKGTGNVYEARSDSHSIKRLSNTTIPKIVRAFWLPDGSGFLAQTISQDQDLIETSFVKLSSVDTQTSTENLTPYTTSISKLPIDIKELVVNEQGTKILYYVTDQSGSSWYTSNPDGTNMALVAKNPLTEWLPKIIIGNKALIQTKNSASYLGYVFTLDLDSKSFNRVGSPIRGLSVLPNNNLSVFLVSQGGNTPNAAIMSANTGITTNINTETLADKCVWSKIKLSSIYCAVPNTINRGVYPDDWYKGKLNFEDSIRNIDYINDSYSNISDLSVESGEKIDVYTPLLSKDDSHLIFKNKIDGFLWMLRIN